MKKNQIFTLLLFLLYVGLTSCSKDADDIPDTKSMVVGKWFIKKAVVTAYTGNNSTIINSSENYTNDDYFELKGDGKYLYRIEGQSELEVSTYQINDEGTILTLNEVDDVEVYKVEKLTQNDLVISQEESYTENNVTIRYVEVITHSKTASK
jgi:hypothetical protein